MRPRNILGVELLECSTHILLLDLLRSKRYGTQDILRTLAGPGGTGVCCCITALRFATRLSRHVVREAPVKDDAAIGGCTKVHDTLPIARQRKETAHR